MKRTKETLKTIVDGLSMYILYYFWTAFLLWFGLWLLDVVEVSYWQSLGGVFAIRQIVGLIANRTDKHLKEDDIDPRTGKPILQE